MNEIQIKNHITRKENGSLDWIKDSSVSKEFRLSIYQDAYFLRLESVLKNDYPITSAFCESIGIHSIWLDFIHLYPSRTPNIGEVGFKLTHFLKTHFHTLYPHHISYKKLMIEASIFETLQNKLFYAGNSHTLNFQTFSELGVYKKIRIQQAAIIKNFHYPIAKISMNLKNKTLDFLSIQKKSPTIILLWRNEHLDIQWESITKTEKKLLLFFKEPHSFNQFIKSNSDISLEQKSFFMRKWLDNGLLCR